MDIAEKDLEDIIFNDLVNDPENVFTTGLSLSLIHMPNYNNIYWHRQVDLVSYGRADIIGYSRKDGCLYVNIIELKVQPLISADFNQVLRYKTAVNEIIKNSFKNIYSEIRCYLIGPSIQDGHFIANNSTVRTITYNFSLRGFKFESLNDARWHKGDGNLSFGHIRKNGFISKPLIAYESLTEKENG
jgi:hypothetical protein